MYHRFPERFVQRVYTEDEQQRLEKLKDPSHYLAGRWAVKEAVLKVLGTGLTGGIRWRDINCIRLPSGAPTVELEGKAAERAAALGIERILVTISHGREVAVANALALGTPP
jgi:holo-[acyl-carrier protein] synthase